MGEAREHRLPGAWYEKERLDIEEGETGRKGDLEEGRKADVTRIGLG